MKSIRLPLFLKNFFWDYEFHDLDWKKDRHLIISSVLSSGDWQAVNWLRHQLGEKALRQWLIDKRGDGLSPQRLRFWELIFKLSNQQVSSWINDIRKGPVGEKGFPINLHEKILSNTQKRVLHRLGPLMKGKGFYLGGGTAIALYLGHRRSKDFDWFSTLPFKEPLNLAQALKDEGIPLNINQIERGILQGTISGIRVSSFEYRYPLLNPPFFWPETGASLASLADLASMKLSAITQRGSKKIFLIFMPLV